MADIGQAEEVGVGTMGGSIINTDFVHDEKTGLVLDDETDLVLDD